METSVRALPALYALICNDMRLNEELGLFPGPTSEDWGVAEEKAAERILAATDDTWEPDGFGRASDAIGLEEATRARNLLPAVGSKGAEAFHLASLVFALERLLSTSGLDREVAALDLGEVGQSARLRLKRDYGLRLDAPEPEHEPILEAARAYAKWWSIGAGLTES